jgi:hypothetical protein
MKKSFFMVALAAIALIGQVDAGFISSLSGPYENFDSIIMTFYKPLIWYVVISWSQNAGCDYVLDNFLDTFITNNTLTSDEQLELC